MLTYFIYQSSVRPQCCLLRTLKHHPLCVRVARAQDVKLYTASSIVQLLLVYAPETPYGDEQLRVWMLSDHLAAHVEAMCALSNMPTYTSETRLTGNSM